jgi:hypothetical protein
VRAPDVLNDEVPNVSCPSCGLTSYAPTPHSTASPCPYCDAELFPRHQRAAPEQAATQLPPPHAPHTPHAPAREAA